MVHLLYIAPLSKALYMCIHSFTHTHALTMEETMQCTMRSNLGFIVLPMDTSTCRQEELGFEPLTHGALDDLLYVLSPITVPGPLPYSSCCIR